MISPKRGIRPPIASPRCCEQVVREAPPTNCRRFPRIGTNQRDDSNRNDWETMEAEVTKSEARTKNNWLGHIHDACWVFHPDPAVVLNVDADTGRNHVHARIRRRVVGFTPQPAHQAQQHYSIHLHISGVGVVSALSQLSNEKSPPTRSTLEINPFFGLGRIEYSSNPEYPHGVRIRLSARRIIATSIT